MVDEGKRGPEVRDGGRKEKRCGTKGRKER